MANGQVVIGAFTGFVTLGMGRHRKPDPPVSWAMHADHCCLVAQVDGIVHPAEGRTRVGCAGVGDRPSGQISVVEDSPFLLQRKHDLSVNEGAREPGSSDSYGLHRLWGTGAQGTADPTVVGPGGLSPSLGHGLKLR